jgi:hypothetical protein
MVGPPSDLDDGDGKPSPAKLALWLGWIAGTLLLALLVNQITGLEADVMRLGDDVAALERGLDQERDIREEQSRRLA